jgi:ferredoxin-type protein NapF
MDLQRRFFLRGRVAPPVPKRVPRPPWAVLEADFIQRCTRCDACLSACPEGILVRGDAGFPEVTFAQRGCSECGACVQACAPQVLHRVPDTPPWSWRPLFSSACLAQRRVECRVCGEMCEHDAIRFKPVLGGVANPVLDANKCTGCGVCVAPCPTQAIQLQEISS